MIKAFIVEHFLEIQIALTIGLALLWTRSSRRDSRRSQFKVREADRKIRFERGESAKESGNRKSKPTPFQLTGIRIDGAPHEVLGISALASEKEIQKSYRDLMKQYHPDLIGRSGSREWKDAQKIAEALNQARNDMIEKLRRR